MVAVAYGKGSSTIKLPYKALTENIFGVSGRWSLKGGGRQRKVVPRGGSIVLDKEETLGQRFRHLTANDNLLFEVNKWIDCLRSARYEASHLRTRSLKPNL